MADSSLSSDLEQDSPLKPPKQRKVSGKWSVSSNRKSLPSRAPIGLDKDAVCHHKALERQCDRARQATLKSLGLAPQTLPSTSADPGSSTAGDPPSLILRSSSATQDVGGSAPSLGSSKRLSSSLPDFSSMGLPLTSTVQRQPPEATFTPTAAGLRTAEGVPQGNPLDIHSI